MPATPDTIDEDFLIEIPAGLDDYFAAMTEPLAVGLEHRVAAEPVLDQSPVASCLPPLRRRERDGDRVPEHDDERRAREKLLQKARFQ